VESVDVVGRQAAGISKVAAVEDHEVIGLNDDIASRWGRASVFS